MQPVTQSWPAISTYMHISLFASLVTRLIKGYRPFVLATKYQATWPAGLLINLDRLSTWNLDAIKNLLTPDDLAIQRAIHLATLADWPPHEQLDLSGIVDSSIARYLSIARLSLLYLVVSDMSISTDS